jgi:hypothetical protein
VYNHKEFSNFDEFYEAVTLYFEIVDIDTIKYKVVRRVCDDSAQLDITNYKVLAHLDMHGNEFDRELKKLKLKKVENEEV